MLLLESDPGEAERVETGLSGELFGLLKATNSAEALTILTSETVDIVLVDVPLSGSSGWDFIQTIREREAVRNMPVVLLTSSTAAADRRQSILLGVDRFLMKPVTSETLVRVIDELLGARDHGWWERSIEKRPLGGLRELLFDPTTDLPTIALIVENLRQVIERGETLTVFCVEIEPLFSPGDAAFWVSFDSMRSEFVRGLQVIVSAIGGNDVVIATSHPGANEFYCFVRKPLFSSPATLARRLEREARDLLRTIRVDPLLLEEVAIFAGAAATRPQPRYAPRVLYAAVREAKDIAERRETRYFQNLQDRVARAVRNNVLDTHFQPVLNLETRKVVGFEALSRGPAGSDIENPEVIFGLARDYHMVWDLETRCIQNVQPMLEDICSRGLLFFNLEANFIQELHERGTEALASFLECEQRVVIEVTERTAIADYRTFRNTMLDLKKLGFKVAIDDCGSGYATLEAVAELKPDYLKVGHSLFRNVENDPIRRRLVELVARCADTIGAVTIAEAIETEGQLQLCRDLDIELGQGYIFARPAPWDEIRDFS
ncbi:MAG TPA: EAL domain-containing response regulator [Thermoanaerobaculia bacterium]|nr:EAL domain-containing response regulator [Thermoanaerobaculia bacterium]